MTQGLSDAPERGEEHADGSYGRLVLLPQRLNELRSSLQVSGSQPYQGDRDRPGESEAAEIRRQGAAARRLDSHRGQG